MWRGGGAMPLPHRYSALRCGWVAEGAAGWQAQAAAEESRPRQPPADQPPRAVPSVAPWVALSSAVGSSAQLCRIRLSSGGP